MQLLIAIAVLVLFLAIKVLKTYKDPVWKDIPGPSYKLPFFGVAFDLVNSGVSTFQSKWAKQYGPVCRYYIWGFTTVLVTDPALVKHVLLNNRLFDKDILDYHFLSDIIGKGLITEWDESKHKYHRSIVGPAFAYHHVRGLTPIFQNKAAILIEDWLKSAGTNVPVSIKEGIAKASSDAIGEAAFGYKLNSQRNESPNSIYHIFAAILGHSYSNVLQVLPIVKNFVPAYHKKMAAIRLIDDQVNKMITEKIQKRNEKKEDQKEQRDLLDVMMDCKNDDGAMLTKAELSDETKTVLLAGYETTSTCIMWTCFLLAKYPEVQQKVADEVLRVLGKDKIPTAEDIDEMPYLYKVLRESLRYYPPVPLFVRRATEDTTLGGFKITRGTRVAINIYHQHHNSPVWDKPEEFNPDRWGNDESEAGSLMGSYMPFILGARNCVGSKFAQLEVRAMIVQKLKLAPVPGRPDPQPLARISTFPDTPILTLFSRRD